MLLPPDGRWLAYVSNASGRNEVYVRPFPKVWERQVPVSRDGGSEPVWSPDGDEIFYRDGAGWMVSARVSTDGALRVESRERLFDASDYASVNGWRGYGVRSGGESFIMLAPRPGSAGAVGDLVLVENLFEEMNEQMGR